MRRKVVTGAPVVVMCLLAGCGEKQPAVTAAAAPVIEITGLDYAFQMPDTIPGGWVTLRLHNKGTELHHAFVVRLEQGKTLADLAALPPDSPLPVWAVAAGGPSAPAPGSSLDAVVKLTPGNYAMLCVIPSADHKPHILKGMVKPFTVVAPTAQAAAPQPDIHLTLSDYDFQFDKPLSAGQHVIAVETAASQPHEIVVARLMPGKTAEELLQWVDVQNGPPPAVIVGGVTGLSSGETNEFPVSLEPGDYALICFIPDAKDGKPHAVHGMMKQIKIT
jgi:hypothetical protein